MKLSLPRRRRPGRSAAQAPQTTQTTQDIPPASFLGSVVSSLRPYRKRIVVALVVLLAGLATTLAGPALVGWMINDGLVHHHSMRVITIAGAAYVAVSVAYFVLTRVQTLMVSGIGETYLNDLRKRVFSHLLAQPLGFFESESSGQLLSRMTADIDVLETLVQSGLSSFVTSIGLFVAIMAVLVVMSPLLFIVVVISLVPAVVSAARYRKTSSKVYGHVRELIGDALASLDESLAGVRVVQAFCQENATIARFAAVNQAQLDGELDTVAMSSRFFPKIELSGVLSSVIVLVAGALLVQGHLTTVGTVAAFVLYLANLFNAITSLSALFDLLQSSGAALATVYKLLAVGPSMVDPERPALLPSSGALELRSVDFAYAGRRRRRQRRAARARGRRPQDRSWREAGPGRAHRWRQVDPRQTGRSPVRPAVGVGPFRRASTYARLCCPTSGNGSWSFPRRAFCSGGPCWKTSPSAGLARPLTRLGMRCASSV